jgi:hypothetical protein
MDTEDVSVEGPKPFRVHNGIPGVFIRLVLIHPD